MTYSISVIAIALSMATGFVAEEATPPQKSKIVANARGVQIQTSMFRAMAPSMEYNAETGEIVLNSSQTSDVYLHSLKHDSEIRDIRASRITLFLNNGKIRAEGIEIQE
jgi:hypothetical protein